MSKKKPVCWITNYGYAGLVEGLEALGWDVKAGARRNWYAWAKGWSGKEDGKKITVEKAGPHDFGKFFRAEIDKHKPKLIIVGKGLDSNVEAPGCKPAYWHILPADLQYARNRGAIVCYLTLDDPNDFGWFTHTTMPDAVDYVGTCCIDTKDAYKSQTRAKVFEFWPAWDPARIIHKKKEYRCQLAIVGSPYMSPQERDDGNPMGPSMSRRDVAMAALKAGVDVKVWGPEDWIDGERGGDPALSKVYQGPVAGHDCHNVFATADVSYNSFVRYARRYVNDRVMFILGAGGFMLAETQLMLAGSFPEADWHRRGDIDDMLERLAYWLENPQERKERAAAGRARILELHTYRQRADVVHAQYLVAREGRRRDNTCCGGKAAMP